MTTASYSTEAFERVYDNSTRDYVEVFPDRDGLGLLGISLFEEGIDTVSIFLRPEHAALVAQSVLRVAGTLTQKEAA